MKSRIALLALVIAVAAGFSQFANRSAGVEAGPGLRIAGPLFQLRRADFGAEKPSAAARRIADWAVHSRDTQWLPFMVVDKPAAKVYAFTAEGRLIGATPVLLGMGRGDVFPPGAAEMADMYQLKPHERVTPAGRYRAAEDFNLEGERVLWVDYDTGIALHRIPGKYTSQRRHERIKSADPEQKRITYGCINVPGDYYDAVVGRHFRSAGGIVYVLPEQQPLEVAIRHYDVARAALARMHSSAIQLTGADRRF